jgi:uncharacterized protein
VSDLERLVAVLDRFERLAIAVSGGVDSMTLAHVARRFARARTTMYHAGGPAVPATARARVDAHARAHGWPLVVLDAGEQRDERYRANPLDRCYYCKTNLYDLADFRPGLQAAAEHGVVHPYVEAGLDKAAVYALAAALELRDLERLPAQPCLASRVETGIAIEHADLTFIDEVETMLAGELGAEATVRCRVTHRGVVVELADAVDRRRVERVRAMVSEACARAARVFAGVRPYRRGAAFLHPVVGVAADD